jgi:fructose-specific phosphotransferase system component IIB
VIAALLSAGVVNATETADGERVRLETDGAAGVPAAVNELEADEAALVPIAFNAVTAHV